LHVWGNDGEISVISPECIASAWLLSMKKLPNLVIVTSNNTNFSDIGRLPVLIDGENKYNGYKQICKYIDNVVGNTRSQTDQLLDSSLISLMLEKFEILNQYNLYVNSQNYEKFTRKLFQNYLPFPMMYNQPLKYYNYARDQVKLLGLGPSKTGFFSFSSNEPVAMTETFNDDIEDEENDQIALSGLHERQLLRKAKERGVIQESKNSLRCLNLIHHYLEHIIDIYKTNDCGVKTTNHRILLIAYVTCFNYEKLPDGFISRYLNDKYGDLVKELVNEKQKLEYSTTPATSYETPSLVNEVKYLAGLVKY
jgi:sorting and assembly machinery component 37